MRKVNVWVVLVLALLVANAIFYFFRPGGDDVLTVVSDTLPAVCALAASVALAGSFGAFSVFDKTKTAWLLLLVGAALFFLGEALYGIQELFLGVNMDETFPSIADVFWLAGYLPFFAGLAILLIGYLQSGLPLGGPLTYVLACAVILGIGAFLIVQLVVPIVVDDTLTPLSRFFYMFYPLADLVLLIPATILFLITSHFGRGALARPWMFIAVGFLLMGAADILYSYLDWQGMYGPGHAIDIAWNASYCVIGLAGWYQARLVRSL